MDSLKQFLGREGIYLSSNDLTSLFVAANAVVLFEEMNEMAKGLIDNAPVVHQESRNTAIGILKTVCRGMGMNYYISPDLNDNAAIYLSSKPLNFSNYLSGYPIGLREHYTRPTF